MYRLLNKHGLEYISSKPGKVGGHKKLKIYGKLDCKSALRWLAKGHYTKYRVFFSSANIAKQAGYRPCAVCLPLDYEKWKSRNKKR